MPIALLPQSPLAPSASGNHDPPLSLWVCVPQVPELAFVPLSRLLGSSFLSPVIDRLRGSKPGVGTLSWAQGLLVAVACRGAGAHSLEPWGQHRARSPQGTGQAPSPPTSQLLDPWAVPEAPSVLAPRSTGSRAPGL